jgi:hypothetical protein
MSTKRSRRGHRLIRRLAESHTATGGHVYDFMFWEYRNRMCFKHFKAMCNGFDKINSQPSSRVNI